MIELITIFNKRFHINMSLQVTSFPSQAAACSLSDPEEQVSNTVSSVAIQKVHRPLPVDPYIVRIPFHRRSVAHLPDALKNETSIMFQTGIKLKVKRDEYSAKLGGTSTGGVKWKFKDGTVDMHRAYLDDLPVWVQIGPPSAWIDPEKGIPTMQACKAMLVNALDLKDRVRKIVLKATNPQTQLDVNLCLLKGSTLEEACVSSQSAYLAAELGEMIGGKVRLVKVVVIDQSIVKRDALSTYLTLPVLPTGRREAFLRQEKYTELENLARLRNPCVFVQSINMEFGFIPDVPLEPLAMAPSATPSERRD